jgi:flagellar motor switch protein FliN
MAHDAGMLMKPESIGEWLARQWSARFAEIMLTMGDVQAEMHVSGIEPASLPSQLVWWEQPFDCGPECTIWCGSSEDGQQTAGKIVLTAAGVDSPPPSEVESTYFELIRQAMSGVAQDIGQRAGRLVACGAGTEQNPPASVKAVWEISATVPDGGPLTFYVIPHPSLSQLLQALAASEQNSGDDPKRPQATPDPLGDSEPQSVAGSRTFDLLLDVELPVNISFGRASLKLNDALKLITGSLIELDRGLSDPVELLVNNCVIARGEVVVIEGNYGVRVTEIVSQKERLQQSRRFMLR